MTRASTLGQRRPIDDPETVRSMVERANLLVTAWDEDLLVGIARTLTDLLYVGYLADLAVRESHQRQGIGVEGISKTRERMGPRSMLVLLSAPKAVDYYPLVLGFQAARERVGPARFGPARRRGAIACSSTR